MLTIVDGRVLGAIIQNTTEQESLNTLGSDMLYFMANQILRFEPA